MINNITTILGINHKHLIVYYATSFINDTLVRHEFYVRHERSVASECLINECLEKFIKHVAYYTFSTKNKQMKQATFLLNVNLNIRTKLTYQIGNHI
jgi:hypothetical protein